MIQVIIFNSTSGFDNVAVCTPTGEVDIQTILTQTRTQHPEAIIVDSSTLPQGADAQFFDAWELADGKVTVNLDKARAFKLTQYNAVAVQEAQKRQLNTLTGIANEVADADFMAKLTADRAAIASATTTAELAAI